jgi:hypothetical protein
VTRERPGVFASVLTGALRPIGSQFRVSKPVFGRVLISHGDPHTYAAEPLAVPVAPRDKIVV